MKQFVSIHMQELLPEVWGVHKPASLNTHRSDEGKSGVIELLEKQLQQKVYPLHRLDKVTSGALLMTTSAARAQEFAELFKNQQIQKKYLFLTDRKIQATELVQKSEILKEKNEFLSRQNSTPNSETHFTKKQSGTRYDLWEATPFSGKSHQIRLHAQDLGIPILGDISHGGSPFSRVCLHSSFIASTELRFSFQSPAWFADHEPVSEDRAALAEALWNRQYFLSLSTAEQGTTAFRWSHHESPHWTLDQMGSQLWLSWYAEMPADPDFFLHISKALKLPLWVREMRSRGTAGQQQTLAVGFNSPISEWFAKENGIQYELHSDWGLSPGLFLDQRENRKWIQSVAAHKEVLNLFSYTGGFSVAAAVGGAQTVCSVDVSRKWLEWSQKNFVTNNIPVEDHEFWSQDAILFLQGTLKRQRTFDLIICDPPTLGRHKNGVFDLKKDWPQLVSLIFQTLKPEGHALLCCNYEGWDLKKFTELTLQSLPSQQYLLKESPGSPLDFEWDASEGLMKSLLIQRKSNRK